jgi:hypothetical protein
VNLFVIVLNNSGIHSLKTVIIDGFGFYGSIHTREYSKPCKSSRKYVGRAEHRLNQKNNSFNEVKNGFS